MTVEKECLTRMQGTRLAGLGCLVALALVCTMVGSCSTAVDGGVASSTAGASYGGSVGPSSSSGGEDSLGVTKDISTWALPFDHVYDEELLRLQVHLVHVWVDECMLEHGFPDYEILSSIDVPYPETNPHGFSTLFNTVIAQKYGYRKAPDPGYRYSSGDVENRDRSYYEDKSQAFKDQMYTCVNEANVRENGPIPTGKPITSKPGSYECELNQFGVSNSDPALASQAKAWVQCMAPQGISDLPSAPWTLQNYGDMPESLKERWSWWPTGQASANEIQVATFDAGCRESSGWNQALYDLTWDRQVAFIAAHRADVQRALDAHAAEKTRLRDLLSQAANGTEEGDKQ